MMKKSLIFLFIFFLVIIISLSYYFRYYSYSPLDSFGDMPSIEIKEKDLRCEKDEDCTLVSNRCSCDCGTPVNINFKEKHNVLLSKQCKSYRGPVCGMECSLAVPLCQNKECTTFLIEDADSLEDCKRISSFEYLKNYYPGECYSVLAKKLNKTSICDEAETEYIKSGCFYNLATELLDYELCNKVKENMPTKIEQQGFLKSRCYYTLASLLRNISLCDKVEEAQSKKECLNLF